jgi:hypothetical protein
MSSLVLLKLFLAPVFVVIMGFIQRRWGDGAGGRLIGLPVTTGPFVLIIYIQEGSSFASKAAHGVLVGQVALIIFCWTYATSVTKTTWVRALVLGTLACLVAGALLTSIEIPLFVLLPLLTGMLIAVAKYWPEYSNSPRESQPPAWELPIRVLATVLLILTLTSFATVLGPRVAGALSTYPVIISVLGAFSHRRYGPNATVAMLHGLIQTLPIAIVIMSVLTIAL